MKRIRTTSQRETARLAQRIARVARKGRPGARRALVIGLSGELGAGKTAFVRSFARALGARGRVASPTFLLARRYPIPGGGALLHADAYRVARASEMRAAGIADAIRDPRNVVVVEWAERIAPLLPKSAPRMRFHHGTKQNERIIWVPETLL